MWLVTSRHVRRVETSRAVRVVLTSFTQPKCMGSTLRTCRVETWPSQVEFGLIPPIPTTMLCQERTWTVNMRWRYPAFWHKSFSSVTFLYTLRYCKRRKTYFFLLNVITIKLHDAVAVNHHSIQQAMVTETPHRFRSLYVTHCKYIYQRYGIYININFWLTLTQTMGGVICRWLVFAKSDVVISGMWQVSCYIVTE